MARRDGQPRSAARDRSPSSRSLTSQSMNAPTASGSDSSIAAFVVAPFHSSGYGTGSAISAGWPAARRTGASGT